MKGKRELKVLRTDRNNSRDVNGDDETKTYPVDQYIQNLNHNADDDVKVSNLQIPNIITDIVKNGLVRTVDNLRELQSSAFPVYNTPEHIGVNGLSPVVNTQMMPMAGPMVQPVNPGMVNPNMVMPPQPMAVPTIGPQAVVPGSEASPIQALPAAMPVTASQGMDPNSPAVANVPITNVVGRRKMVAAGVLPNYAMETHPALSSRSVSSNGFSKIDFETMGRNLIVITIVIFLLIGCVFRIKSRKKSKNKR